VSNPAAKVKLPRKVKYRANFYTKGELNDLCKALTGTKLEVPVILAGWFGLSRGEVIGLRWDAICYEAETLSVTGTVTNKGSGKPAENEVYRPKEAKRESRIRSFPLSEQQIRYLKSIQQKQAENRLLAGNSYNTEYLDFVCVDKMGDRLHLDYVTASFPDTLKKLGLRSIRFHDLRHTNISLLLEKGHNMKDLQAWAGHAQLSTTADTYSHIQAKAKQKLTNSMSDILCVNC